MGNYEKVVNQVGRRGDIERYDLAWTVDGRSIGLLIEKDLLTRLVVGGPGSLLACLESLPEFRIFLLQLPDLSCFILGPHYSWQWHRLENRRQEVVQTQKQRFLILLSEVDCKCRMFFGILAELEVEPVSPVGLGMYLKEEIDK